MHHKSDITLEEEEAELIRNGERYNLCNPSFAVDIGEWREKLAKAKEEGYKSEKCSCGNIMLAFHHWTRCSVADCPFSTGKSMLDYMEEGIENGEEEKVQE